MPLQLGTWNFNYSGLVSQLQITNVDAVGNVTAKIAGVASPGIWEETGQKLILNCANKMFVGYLFTDTLNLMGVAGLEFLTLAGYVDCPQAVNIPGLAPTLANSQRSTFGWYAQIGVD